MMTKVNKKFAQLIKQFRVTNYQAAEWLECSVTMVSYWKTGLYDMKTKHFKLFKEKLIKHFTKLLEITRKQ